MNSASHLRNKSNVSKKSGAVDPADFHLNGNERFALEIDENDMKSMKSMKSIANQRHKLRLTGVPDLSKVRESVDLVGRSRTDDRVFIASKVNKNPKLQQQGHDIKALESDDFDSEKQVNKESIDIEIESDSKN